MSETRTTVTVTPKHIAAGTPGNPRGCPLSLAIAEATGADVYVSKWGIAVGPLTYQVPSRLWGFLDDVDRNEPVGPLSFVLEDLTPALYNHPWPTR